MTAAWPFPAGRSAFTDPARPASSRRLTRDAIGDPNPLNLSKSSPAARDYVTTMARDITTPYKPDMVQLERPNFMGFMHRFHHEKDGVGFAPIRPV